MPASPLQFPAACKANPKSCSGSVRSAASTASWKAASASSGRPSREKASARLANTSDRIASRASSATDTSSSTASWTLPPAKSAAPRFSPSSGRCWYFRLRARTYAASARSILPHPVMRGTQYLVELCSVCAAFGSGDELLKFARDVREPELAQGLGICELSRQLVYFACRLSHGAISLSMKERAPGPNLIRSASLSPGYPTATCVLPDVPGELCDGCLTVRNL